MDQAPTLQHRFCGLGDRILQTAQLSVLAHFKTAVTAVALVELAERESEERESVGGFRLLDDLVHQPLIKAQTGQLCGALDDRPQILACDRIHDQLSEVYDELCAVYVWLVDEAVDAMNSGPKAGDPILDDNRYMDGSQVWTSQPPGSTEFPVQAIYCGDLGPDLPPACEVIVADPPHWRMLKAQAPRQDGDSAFKDLKARLLEVIEAER